MQDDLDGSCYRTLSVKFHQISLFLRSRVRRQDDLDGSVYDTLGVEIYENIMILETKSAHAG